MTLFQISGIVLALVAGFGYINHRFIKLPDTLGATAVGMLASVLMVFYGQYDAGFTTHVRGVIANIEFSEVVFHGLLALLLFASSLHINLQDLRSKMLPIFMLATVGVLVSTVVVGMALHLALQFVGMDIPVLYCMLFGALISPTDPIAVLSVLKNAGAPKSIETKIAGESLFNDASGVVAFMLLLGLATGAVPLSWSGAAALLAQEVVGGLATGAALGFLTVAMLRGVDSYPVEIITTLAAVIGGYSLAEYLHVSAPLSTVVLGLVVGTRGVAVMSETTREHLFSFWELLDEILNLVLFGLIGIMIVSLSFGWDNLVAAAIAVPVVLLGRLMSVVLSLIFDPKRPTKQKGVVSVLTWGGLRGGISIALVLSLPQFEGRTLLVSATYAVVLFSLLVQAPTLSHVAKCAAKPDTKPGMDAGQGR